MRVTVAIYQHIEGRGWFDIALGHMDVKTQEGLTERVARNCLTAFLNHIWAADKRIKDYSPADVVAGATFGDLGTLYVDGYGIAKEKTDLPSLRDCSRHPDRASRWSCRICQKYFCTDCRIDHFHEGWE